MQDVKTEVEIEKMKLEMDKIRAETRKLSRETGLIPFLAGAAVTVAITGLVGVMLKLLGGN